MVVITGVLFALVATFVDLKPVVDQNFFFSTNDPGIQQTKEIERRFPSQPEVILAVSSRDISSPRYLGRIQKLTQRVHTIDGVSAVKSLAEGPKTFNDALKSPFWRRLLIAHHRKSSVSSPSGSRLNTDEACKRTWTLPGALENYKDVGTVISLPTLLAEGDRTPFSFLVSYEKIMEIMEQPKYARVAKSFVTGDRTQAVLLLRMIEARRTKIASMLSTIFALSAENMDSRLTSSAAFIICRGDCPSLWLKVS